MDNEWTKKYWQMPREQSGAHQELDVIFVFSQLRSDVTVRFVDFGGIVDCLNFLK
jgi:hypothetical protein